MQVQHIAIQLMTAKITLNTDDQGDRYALELGAVVAPNFLVAVGYTSVADQYSYRCFQYPC